ncbi:WD repeat-containing protein on Y chromosome-like, partial [Ochlerotatus camptorhynchus]|uniref:WD repeat-containing protein on Y chromosome-like n=1 Tax=Ochlerotatus camptorhynchus TaxID=644619 RepID=UPI0031E008DD
MNEHNQDPDQVHGPLTVPAVGAPTFDAQLLHRYLSHDDIEELYKLFFSRRDQILPHELREELYRLTGVQLNDAQFETLFMRMNTNLDEYCQWDELLSYLILGLQNDDPMATMVVQESLDLPISCDTERKLPGQTYPVTKIEYSPLFTYDEPVNWDKGYWITSSREGEINFWNRDWKHTKIGNACSVDLKRTITRILDTAVLPDQHYFCVTCLECELRFYDIFATGFTLKMIVNRIPNAINKLYYHFSPTTGSIMVLGDYVGFVRVLQFKDKFDPATDVIRMTFLELIEGSCRQMTCTDYGRLLPDIVRQVQFVESTNSIVVCSENDPLDDSTLQTSLVIQDAEKLDRKTEFVAPKGVLCFAFNHEKDFLATGGPDGKLRLWDCQHPGEPTATLAGHRARVVFLFLQDGSEKLYSMDCLKIVIVWDVRNKALFQKYSAFSTNLHRTLQACAYYNDRDRELLVGANKVLAVSCCPKIKVEVTDGKSHTLPISILLYNPLFKMVVSCGLDSFIIVWDYTNNRRLTVIADAHTEEIHGIVEKVQITAACFDPKLQLLITGDRIGILKIWHFNSGSLMSSLSIERNCEVTAIFWEPRGILAMGWNHVIVEFPVGSSEMEFLRGNPWKKLHFGDIICAAINHTKPKTIATCSYSGELIFWRIDTGEAYRRYDAARPRQKIPIDLERKPVAIRRRTRMSIFQPQRRLTRIVLPTAAELLRQLTIYKLLFLEARPRHPEYGTLIASLDTGSVQVYSHDLYGEYLGSFSAVHKAGDRVIAMTTDPENRFLFTGSRLGYVKVWLIEDYCVPEARRPKVNRPALRMKFPFLLDDVVPGRAKRSVANQPKPWLLNSYQAHRACVTDLVYLADSELLLSSSSDRSIRIWTLGGRYVGLLGSPVKWPTLELNSPVPSGYRFRIPPELEREVSFTTAQVLRGGERCVNFSRLVQEESQSQIRTGTVIETYGEPLDPPYWKRKTFPFGQRTNYHPVPKMDPEDRGMIAYGYLRLAEMKTLKLLDSKKMLTEAEQVNVYVDRIDS